jgi:steroid 5-alpha reductase family enzyme
MARSLLLLGLLVVLVSGVAYAVGGPVFAGVPALVWLGWASLAVNLVAFVPAAIGKTERFYDLTGALTSTALASLALGMAAAAGTLTVGSVLAASAVVLWAGRLGLFLFARVRREGDGRFDTIKTDPARFLVAWSLQGTWVFFTTLAALALTVTGPALGVGYAFGLSIWATGFAVEVLADRQKCDFRADPANAGRFIDTGLWRWSRHPNYAGEIAMWTGMFVAGVGTWQGGQWLTALSPVFVYLLLTRVSGIPLLEKRADERWGDNPAYQAYKARTPVLFPRP